MLQFVTAAALGADYIEVRVQLTADGARPPRAAVSGASYFSRMHRRSGGLRRLRGASGLWNQRPIASTQC
jgi:hypothetical protein